MNSKLQDYLSDSNYAESMISESIAEGLRRSSIDYPMPENPLFSDLPKIIKHLEDANNKNEELKEVIKRQGRFSFLKGLIIALIGALVGAGAGIYFTLLVNNFLQSQ